jgi:hypothetical protein
VSCTAPFTAFYALTQQWGAITGGAADLSLTFDPSACLVAQNPTCRAVLNYSAVSGVTQLTGSAASRVTARAAQATPNFGSATLGGATPQTTSWLGFVTGPGFTNLQTVAIIRYTIGAGAAGPITTNTVVSEVSDPIGDAFLLSTTGATPNLVISQATLNVP